MNTDLYAVAGPRVGDGDYPLDAVRIHFGIHDRFGLLFGRIHLYNGGLTTGRLVFREKHGNVIKLKEAIMIRAQKLHASVVVLTIMLLLSSASVLKAQLVTNGGFESSDTGAVTGTDVKGWVIQVADTVNPKPVFQIVSDTVEQGSRALKVTLHGLGSNDWDIQVVADSIPVTPGATYSYTIWAKSQKAGATVNFTVGNYSYSEYGAIRPATLSTHWQQYKLTFKITDSQTIIRAPIHFYGVVDTGNSIYIDNLRIVDANAPAKPVIVEAESGALGSNYSVTTDGAVTYITPKTNYAGQSGPGDTSRVATYQVTFADSGEYSLFTRLRVGPGGFDDDSYFYAKGFGEKNDTVSADWVFINGLAAAGFSDSGSVVDGPGTLGNSVWKWVNVTRNSYQGTPGDSFHVSLDSLTRTFQIGSREDGLDIDKIAFGKTNLYYTVYELDNGLPGTKTNPAMDSSLFWKGPALAAGQAKFLGNAYGDIPDNVFANYWNQLTPANAGKWGSVAGSSDTTKWNWTALDAQYNYAMDHHLIFKDHNMVWGAQQPSWISSLDSAQQIKYIETWFRMVGARYPNMDMVDVVNEPLAGHNPPDGQSGRANYEQALGGPGATGWDWVIKAFELARTYMPNAKLLLNDFGIINSNSATTTYLQVINLLKTRGLIDGIGVQGHRFELESADTNTIKSNLARLGATGLPVYISEFDLGNLGNTGTPDDAQQLQLYKKIFPILWKSPAVKGITLWGYLENQTWQTTCFLVNTDGSSRPALTWMAQYVKDNPTGVGNTVSTLPAAFRLEQNYPNPFNPTTTIKYQLPEAGNVTLKVYDVLGRVVETLVNERQAAGYYNVSFDAGKMSSGVYFYQLVTARNSSVKKMVLLK